MCRVLQSKRMTGYASNNELEAETRCNFCYEAHKDSADRMGDTIKYCVEHDILKEYIERKGKEVLSMLTMDWDYEEALKVANEEGEKQGAQKREKELVINLYQEKDPLSKISRVTGKTVDEIRQILLDNGISV